MGSSTRSLLLLRVAIVTLLLQLSYGQANNPIIRPQAGEILHAGTIYNITWTPNTGSDIGIELWNGFSVSATLGANCDLDEDNPNCHQVIVSTSNSGFYEWAIPANAPTSNTYWLDIYVPDPDINGPYYFMTGNFTIQKAINPHQSSSSASATLASVQSGTSSGNATAATTSASGALSAGAVGGIVGGVLGIALFACGITIFVLYRRRKGSTSGGSKGIKLNAIPSGRTAEETEAESVEEKEELEEETSFARKPKGSNGLRYMEDDEQWGLPSGRLQQPY